MDRNDPREGPALKRTRPESMIAESGLIFVNEMKRKDSMISIVLSRRLTGCVGLAHGPAYFSGASDEIEGLHALAPYHRQRKRRSPLINFV
ncbi:MAG: hypothetical protein ACOY3L_16465 [Pseudomonadota bacterium]